MFYMSSVWITPREKEKLTTGLFILSKCNLRGLALNMHSVLFCLYV